MIVVAAAIVGRGRLLVAQRAHPPKLAGCWELPGGKVRSDERDEQALIRECREELGVEVRPTTRLDGEWQISPTATLRVWAAVIDTGMPQPLEHAELRWVESEQLDTVRWLPADRLLLPLLRTLLDDYVRDDDR